jgi:hypothetical protein
MGRPYWNLRRQKPVIYCSYTAGFSVLRRARFTRHFWCGRHGLDLSRPAGSVHRDVVRFIESPPRTGAENRTTRVLPNPDNSCAYDIEPQSFDAMITKTQNSVTGFCCAQSVLTLSLKLQPSKDLHCGRLSSAMDGALSSELFANAWPGYRGSDLHPSIGRDKRTATTLRDEQNARPALDYPEANSRPHFVSRHQPFDPKQVRAES